MWAPAVGRATQGSHAAPPIRAGPIAAAGAAPVPRPCSRRVPPASSTCAPSPASRTVLWWPPGGDASPACHQVTLESNCCSTSSVDPARATTSSRMRASHGARNRSSEGARGAGSWCDGDVTTAPARHLVTLGPGDLADRLSEALQVYVAAMGYPPSTARQRRALWLDHVRRPGWRAVGWLDDRDALVGVAYGYTGGPGQWWYEEVRRGLRGTAAEARGWLRDYFELTELHVRPDAQGAGLGEGLLRALLTGGRGTSRAAVHTGVRRPVAGACLAALPPYRVRGRAARAPVHRRLPPLRRAGRHAAARATAPSVIQTADGTMTACKPRSVPGRSRAVALLIVAALLLGTLWAGAPGCGRAWPWRPTTP